MKLLTATLDGKRIAYTDETVFIVQIGKGRSAYKTKTRHEGKLSEAVFNYRCINIGNGFKKRLLMLGANKPILARQLS